MRKKIFITISIFVFILLDIISSRYIFSFSIKPNWWLIFTLFCALFIGHTEAVVVGFICGTILDILHMEIFGLYAITLSTIGYFFGLFYKKIDETLTKVQIIILFSGSVINFLLYVLLTKFFFLPLGYSNNILLLPLLDTFIGFFVFKALIYFYELYNY